MYDPTGRWGDTLYCAAKAGDFARVSTLLADGYPVIGYHSGVRATALHAAAQNGHASVCRLLLEHGADAIATDDRGGCVPLHFAVVHGHAEVVKELLIHPVELHATPLRFGLRKPLYLAAEYDQPDIIDLLIAAGADAARDGLQAFRAAVQHSHQHSGRCVQALAQKLLPAPALDGGRDHLIDHTYTLVHIAARSGSTDGLTALAELSRGWPQRTPLQLAVRYQQLGAIRTLVHLGAEMRDSLHDACFRVHSFQGCICTALFHQASTFTALLADVVDRAG